MYALMYGFLDGSFIGLISIVTMQIVGLEDIGQGWGMMLLSISLPIALGPPTVGMYEFGFVLEIEYFSKDGRSDVMQCLMGV